MINSRLFFSVLALIFLGPWPAAAAPEALCREYAQISVHQYNEAVALGVPNIGPPAWHNDYNAHLAWCLSADEAATRAELQKREDALAPYRAAQTQGAPPQPPAPPSQPSTQSPPLPQTPPPAPGGETGAIVGPLMKADDACARYAKDAVAQQQLNVQKKCGFKGPRWSADQAYHENWCRRQSSIDPAMAEHKARLNMLTACQTPATPGLPPKPPAPQKNPKDIEPLLVPGLVLAMWHGKCGYFGEPGFSPDALSKEAEGDWLRLRKQVRDGKTKTYFDMCSFDLGSPHDDYVGLAWIQIADIPTNFDLLKKLPPGLILALRPRSKAFGETPAPHLQTVSDSPLPGVKTYCAPDIRSGGDYVRSCTYAWFETANDVHDVDWSLVERLPRFTILGLKYTSNNDGDWVGNQRWKKLRWIGPDGRGMKLYDPACKDCAPPPGFIRIEAGDWGAPAGQGFVWFMKVTGPDITQVSDKK